MKKSLTLLSLLSVFALTIASSFADDSASKAKADAMAKHKADEVAKIDLRIQKLQEFKTCINNATNHDAMKACHETMKQFNDAERAQRPAPSAPSH